MRFGLLSLIAVCMIVPLAFATLSGPAPIPNPPSFRLTTQTTTLCRGMTNYIPINITNGGSVTQATMSSITVGLAPGVKGLYESGNGTVAGRDLRPGQSETVYLPVFVSANVSELVFGGITINYYYNTLYSDYEVRNTSFATQTCPQPLSVSLSPQVLTAGVIQNMALNLTNTGAIPINSISVIFTLPGIDGAWLSPQPLQITTLAPHTTMRVNESVYISRNASQSVPLNVTASYYNGTSLQQAAIYGQFLASGVISMSPSSFTTSPAVPTPQSVFSISFILTNTGTSAASAVTVTPIPPAGFTSYGTNTVFVGSIGVDTQTPVTVSLIASNSVKSGSYSIPIKVSYMNGLRQSVTTWANTSVVLGEAQAINYTQIARARGGGGGGLVILILIVLVIVLLVLLIRERRRAK